MTPEERLGWIERYERGPALIEAELALVPKAALQWRPAPGKWSVHEVVAHCGDSEVNAHMRIRYVVCEREPLIVGYDENHWARELDYHAQPLELALAAVRAVRANTVPLLRNMNEQQWQRAGRHTERTGPYSAESWLQIYAGHLEVHARQIARTLGEWRRAQA